MTASRAVASPAPAPARAPVRAQRAPSNSLQRAAAPARRPAPADARFSAVLQLHSALQVSTPSDPAEREAESTAEAVVSMSAPPAPALASAGAAIARSPAAPTIQRKATGDRSLPPAVGSDIQGSRGSGAPLPPSVRSFMEPRFGADFGGVRVHAGDRAARLSNRLSAQAFTVGDQIFFAGGQYRPDSPEGRRLLAHELTHTIQQGAVQQGKPASPVAPPPPPGARALRRSMPVQPGTVNRRADVTVSQRTGPAVQRLGMQDALNFFADKANMIPGYRMFTILLGVNPINMSAVERSAANILRAIVEFLPGGGLVTQALDAYGVFDRVGGWIEGQLSSLGISGASIKQSITRFLDSLSWTDIFNLDSVWERAKAIFTGPIDRIISFVKSLGRAVLQFIKDAILRPIAELASQAPGWDLLCAVLGRNPITGDAVPRTAETLIGGFMKLIGQEEIWENIKKGNAIARAYAWFQTALAGLMGFVQRIPGLFMDTLRSLEIEDLVLLPKAYIKVGKAFVGFVVEFVTWAGGTIWDLLEIVFSVVAPSVIVYVKKAAGAFKKILKDPISFVRNLVAAGKLGFNQFAGNFLKHLKKALLDWLTGALGGAGIYIPQALSLVEIGKCVLSVLGITWPKIRAKIVKALGSNGETIMKALETGFDIVVALVRGGPAAAWDVIKQKLTDLKDMVIQAIIDFVKQKIVEAAVKKIVAMLVPGGGFISAILTIYDAVMVFVQRLKQIAAVVAAFIDGIAAIANGQIAGAAAKVEQVMANLLSLVVAFLARFAGLGKIADYLVGKVKVLQAKVDQALDKGVEWIVAQAKRLGRAVMGAVKKATGTADERTLAQKEAALKAAVSEAQKIDPESGRRSVMAELRTIRGRHRLTDLSATPDGKGKLKVHAAINPDLTFELADYDDGLLTDLHTGFTAAAANVAKMKAPRKEEDVTKVCQAEIRQKHAGVAVTTRRTGDLLDVVATPPAGKKPIKLGQINLVTGETSMTNDLLLAPAVAAGRSAVEGLAKEATLIDAQNAFTAAFRSKIPEAQITFAPGTVGEASATLVLPKMQKSLGVLVSPAENLYEPAASPGPNLVFKHKVNKAEFVDAAKSLKVQRFVWRNVNAIEARILTTKGEPVSEDDVRPDLPPRPMADDAPPGLKGKVAKTPFKHVINAKMASIFSSASTIADGTIVNRETGQVFKTKGTIKIDLAKVESSRIVVLSTAAGRLAWGLVSVSPGQAELDAAATREVLIKNGIPGASIVEFKK